MQNYVQDKKENCCGCTACANACPKGAISIESDEKGFRYPVINQDICINCGLCKKACDFNSFEKNTYVNDIGCFGVRHKDSAELMSSRSGGFFSAVSDYVLELGGISYGACLDQDLAVRHKRALTKTEADGFKGSKYVQSIIPDSLFSEIKEELIAGKKVLFSGSGCQVHGLIKYLDTVHVNRDNLITVDIVCHGVPSPGVWSDFISVFEDMNHCKINEVNFKDKAQFGWANPKETYSCADGHTESNSRWMEVYYLNCMFRESCYKCPYTTPYRYSDFTIGDFWGFEKVISDFRDDRGVSLVITHNKKAREIVEALSEKSLTIYEVDLEESKQPQLIKPSYKGPEYNRFWKCYKKSHAKAIKKYFFPGKGRRLYLRGYKTAKRVAKKLIRVRKK